MKIILVLIKKKNYDKLYKTTIAINASYIFVNKLTIIIT